MNPPIGAARAGLLGSVTADPLTVIDQFDSIADYDHQQGEEDVTQTTATDPDLPSWVDDNVFEASDPGYTELNDTGGGSLPVLPSKGDDNTTILYASSSGSEEYGPSYNVIDGQNHYSIRVEGTQVRFFKYDSNDGGANVLNSWTITDPGTDLISIEFKHGNGSNDLSDEEHLIRVNNVTQGNTLLDTTHTVSTPLSPSDGFGVVFNSSGTMRFHGAAISGQTTTDDGSNGGGGTGTYYTGNTLLTSDYPGPQDAINAASSLDTVVFDETETVPDISPASLVVDKADIKIEGGDVSGNHIEAENTNPTGDILRIEEPAKNVWVDNLTIDCRCDFAKGGGASGAARGIGGQDIGELDHIRITNCTVKSSGRNAINFVNGDSNGVQGDLTDFYISNNTVLTADSHGILMGVYDDQGPTVIENVIMEYNYVEETNSQACGIFAQQEDATASNCLYLFNEIQQAGTNAGDQGSSTSFESIVNNAAYYGNIVDNKALLGGPSSTKGGVGTAFVRNEVYGGGRALRLEGDQGRTPTTIVMQQNVVDSANHAVHADGDQVEGANGLRVDDNEFINCSPTINDASDVELTNNGTSLGVSTGQPSSPTNPVEFTNTQGETQVAISWDVGGPDPSNPVSVFVDVSLDGGASV